MFCGQCFAMSNDSLTASTVSSKPIDVLTIKNLIIDELFIISEIIDMSSDIPDDWTFNTDLHVLFDNNLYGGNVNFTVDIIDKIRIKKKTIYDTNYKTIYEKEINTEEDFNIELIDYFEPVGNISYAYVPIISNAESEYITNDIESKFDSYFICNRDASYPIILDTGLTITETYENGTVKPIGRNYPIVIVNGNTGYKNFELSAKFIEINDCKLDVKNAWSFRNTIHNFLKDGTAKILKDVFGNIYMTALNGDISDSQDSYTYYNGELLNAVDTSFSMVEIGNAYDVGDLYDNNFIDIDIDR